MKRYKEIYICDKCNYESENPQDFLEFIGNVVIPGNTGGGIIGNNIFSVNDIPDTLQNAIANKEIEIVNINNACVIVPQSYCINCAIKMLIGQPNANTQEKITKLIETLKENYLNNKEDESSKS
jgi:hypothetical protein